MAPTEVPLTPPPLTLPPHISTPSHLPSSPSPLLHRLTSSEPLAELCKLCRISMETAALGWKCFATIQDSDESSVYMILVPSIFFRGEEIETEQSASTVNKEGGKLTAENGGKVVPGETQVGNALAIFVLPVILLHCHQDILMDPDPATPNPPSLLPDIYQRLHLSPSSSSSSPSSVFSSASSITTQDTPSLQSSLSAGEPPSSLQQFYTTLASDGLRSIVSKLRAVHFSSYLYSVHTALLLNQPLPPLAFSTAINICRSTALSIDCTSLIATVCRHAQVELQSLNTSHTQLPTQSASGRGSDILAYLLEHLSSSGQSHCRVSFTELGDCLAGVAHCLQREGELAAMFRQYLLKVGFEEVPGCEGYYWLRGENAEESLVGKVKVFSCTCAVLLLYRQ